MMKARRIALAAGCLALLGAPAPTASAQDQLPDLVVEPPGVTYSTGRPLPLEVNASTNRLVLPFNSVLRNQGAGPAELIGQNPVGGQMTNVFQRIAAAGGGFRDVTSNATMRYETTDGHNHWHFMSAARYSLWTSSRSYQVGLASKIGFCLQDSTEIGGPPPGPRFEQNSACAQGNPAAPQVDMGISPGWPDLYQYSLPLQWVDVSDVQPGQYRVRAEIDPTNVIVESQERHRPVFSTINSTVPGFPAQPFSRRVSANRASRITLKASEVDSLRNTADPRNRQFRIVSKPANGRLKQRAGRWFAGPVVTYVPRRGYTGPDTFTFQARDKATRFPLAPRTATVTLQVGSGDGPTTIAVSGYAARLPTEASMKLVGKVLSGPRRLTWKVNGRRGGSSRFGTISRKGLYTAPANAPGRAVRIEASTRDGRKKTVRVRIVDNSVPALPSTNTPGGAGTLSRVAATRQGSFLQSKFVSRRSGKVTVSVTRKGEKLGGCRVQAVRSRPVTCETLLPRAAIRRRAELGLRVSLTRGRRTLATRARRVSLGGGAVAGTASRSAGAAGGPGLICYIR